MADSAAGRARSKAAASHVPADYARSVTLAVFDIDGVVADVRHRLHHLERRPKDWGGFFAAAGDDTPLDEGVALATDLARQHDVAWLTGRPEWLRATTMRWLDAYGLPNGELFLRGNGDRRPARLYKLGVLRRLARRRIAAFIDDDVEVIEAAQQAGYPAVLADWVPRAPVLRDAQERLGRT
jgi:phosphoglycolate phosphatase-like HAD superfamily hydrolase